MATQQGAGPSGRPSSPDPSRAPLRSADDFESEVGNGRTAATTREERIAAAAYRRAEARDFAPGLELDDWLTAEREIDEQIASDQLRSSTPSMR